MKTFDDKISHSYLVTFSMTVSRKLSEIFSVFSFAIWVDWFVLIYAMKDSELGSLFWHSQFSSPLKIILKPLLFLYKHPN